jgi:hypothetical protein
LNSGRQRAAGLVVAGLVVAGLVVADLVLAGLVVADLVLAGLVVADLVLAGLVLAGPVLAGPVLAGPVLADPVLAGPVVADRGDATRNCKGMPAMPGHSLQDPSASNILDAQEGSGFPSSSYSLTIRGCQKWES